MQNVTITIYRYDELSQEAQNKAFESNRAAIMDDDIFRFSDDLKTLIEVADRKADIEIFDWEYSQASYSYDIKYNPRICGEGEDYHELKGIRAIKEALQIYYRLTEESQVFGKRVDSEGNVTYAIAPRSNRFVFTKSKISLKQKSNSEFTDCYLSGVFSDALLSSIKDNAKLDSEVALKDHLRNAADAMFQELVDDADYIYNEALEEVRCLKFLKDGRIFDFEVS